MKKLLIAVMAAGVACGGSGALKDQARDAMPSKDTVAMGSPKTTNGTTAQRGDDSVSSQDSTAGDPSPFFTLTVGVAGTFNGAAAAFLGLIEAVVAQEPTSCNATSCTWGPGSSALDYNNYQLVVSKNADGTFHWELAGQAKSKPGSNFVTLASGDATPGAQPHHGSGSFTVNFDNSNTLDGPHDATGVLNVNHYTNVGPASLDVTYMGAKDGNHPDQKNNIVYAYANDATGGGDLNFAVHNTTTGDNFSVHSRWKNDGEGRADVQGLGSGYSVSISECWGVAPFLVAYFQSTLTVNLPPFGGPASGDQAQCAYTSASFSTKQAP
jgi:hypothetical protein